MAEEDRQRADMVLVHPDVVGENHGIPTSKPPGRGETQRRNVDLLPDERMQSFHDRAPTRARWPLMLRTYCKCCVRGKQRRANLLHRLHIEDLHLVLIIAC